MKQGTHLMLLICIAAVSLFTADGPIARWSFDESGGTTAKDSIGDLHGTVRGKAGFQKGRFGNCLSLPGTAESYFDLGAKSEGMTLTSSFTFTLWTKSTGRGINWPTLLRKAKNPDGRNYMLSVNPDTGALFFGCNFENGTALNGVGATKAFDGEWHHIAVAFDAPKKILSIFVDGVLDRSFTTPSDTLVATAEPFSIGQYAACLIDEVNVYDRPLSAAAIADDRSRVIEESTAEPRLEKAGSGMKRILLDYSGAAMDDLWKLDLYRKGVTAALSFSGGQENTLHADYHFTSAVDDKGGAVYVRLTRTDVFPEQRGISFAMESSPRADHYMRIAMADGQVFQAKVMVNDTAWSAYELPFDTAHFKPHASITDGIMRFPVRTITIDTYKGKIESPARCSIKNVAALVTEIRPEMEAHLSIKIPGAGGIVFIGEKAPVQMRVANRSERAREFVLSLTQSEGNGRVKKTDWKHSLPPGASDERSIQISTDEPEYTGMTAVLNENGKEIMRVRGAVAVVHKPKNSGSFDSQSMFGISQTADRLPELLAPMGCKIFRAIILPGSHSWDGIDSMVGRMRSNGIQVVLCPDVREVHGFDLLGCSNVSELISPEHIGKWKTYIKTIVERYKDTIAGIEICNEPNGQIGRNLPFEDFTGVYAALLKTAYDTVKSIAPNLPVLGIGDSGINEGRNGNYAYFERVAQKAGDTIDICPYHVYLWNNGMWSKIGDDRRRTIYPDEPVENQSISYSGILTRAGDILVSNRAPRRFWVTETGYTVYPRTDDPLEWRSYAYAAALAQTYIVGGTTPGVEKLFWFTAHWHPGHVSPDSEFWGEYNLFGCNFPLESRQCLGPYFPYPAVSSYATTAYELHHAKFIRTLDTPSPVRAHRFDREDDRSVVALWTRHDIPFRMEAKLPAAAKVVSMFGNTIGGTGTFAHTLDRGPVYISVKRSEADMLEQAILRAQIKPTARCIIRNAYLASLTDAVLVIDNPFEAFAAQVRAGGSERSESIAAGAQRVNIALAEAASPKRDVRIQFSAGDFSTNITLSASGILACRYIASAVADGDLSETADLAELRIDTRESVLPKANTWRDAADLSARAFFGWNENGLYFAATVIDDVHSAADDKMGDFWKSDSIQIAIDSEGDSARGYDANDREIGLVLGASGAHAYLYRGAMSELKCDVHTARKDGRTVYEVFMPWKEMGLSAPKANTVMPMNFIVNENDGRGRTQWMGITPGIGEAKAPQYYKRFVLLPQRN